MEFQEFLPSRRGDYALQASGAGPLWIRLLRLATSSVRENAEITIWSLASGDAAASQVNFRYMCQSPAAACAQACARLAKGDQALVDEQTHDIHCMSVVSTKTRRGPPFQRHFTSIHSSFRGFNRSRSRPNPRHRQQPKKCLIRYRCPAAVVASSGHDSSHLDMIASLLRRERCVSSHHQHSRITKAVERQRRQSSPCHCHRRPSSSIIRLHCVRLNFVSNSWHFLPVQPSNNRATTRYSSTLGSPA